MSAMTGAWCLSCWQTCPGRDADGYCLRADRSDPRLAQTFFTPGGSVPQCTSPERAMPPNDTREAPALDYYSFLASKRVSAPAAGFEVPREHLSPALFPWQADIVRWALRRGKAALFEDCGLGKTLQQLVWAEQVARHTGRPVLILAPLAVGAQTAREGERFGIPATLCRTQADVRPGVNVANYEMLHHFDPSTFGGVVLDESSILKSFMGATKRALIEAFAETPYRLACTATPSPNDHMELGNHAEFLGVMPSNEMLARWFINDTKQAGNYQLKGHAARDFWAWVSSWAVSLARPSDLGYPDDGFILPELVWITHVVEVDLETDRGDQLFRCPKLSSTELHKERRRTVEARAYQVADLVAHTPGPWVLWCDTDYEADALAARIPEAVEVRGSHPLARKEATLEAFARGEARVLITKPSICAWGMNWQHCSQMAFVGLSYSFEQLYQAVRRAWRFGQQHPVAVHVVMAESELSVLSAIQKKQDAHEEMKSQMIEAMRETGLDGEQRRRELQPVETERRTGCGWELRLGDCCQELAKVESDSVGFTVFSPPFSNLYIYSDSEADMGNCADDAEFFEHFAFLIPELYRVTIPGRLCAVHCKDLPLYKGRDGAAGLKDFPGELTRAFEAHGWTYHSKVTIWKSPVIEMQRTKCHGLLYKNLLRDSCGNRQGMPDYLLVFRKWGEAETFPAPVPHARDEFPLERWQEWASPVWMDIEQMDVLNYQLGKDPDDEKHICPLQLEVIRRALYLWSNPGDLVLSPFAGIGSEGHVAVRLGRRFLGIELKRGYFELAARHLRESEFAVKQPVLFDELAGVA
ncbi:MAG TPA: DNA methyltransferase [Armatimonadota bacterium]|nr:DNA methyltransferase [Armatimonadota bacterium]